ncbi:hypothetical protein BD779DRAFT_1047478 [Infundibulicybe gibba]|nr:hypothetical protein BD779DRAFT_1047478 [Infundibulicybe gibba]
MLLHVHSTPSKITSSDHSIDRPPPNSSYLAFPAPRSSSLPRTVPMGQPHSKSTAPPLSSSPSGSATSQGSAKGLSFGGAAVAGGLKLKRAFARRRKLEDAPLFTSASGKERGLNQLDVITSIASSPAQLASPSSRADEGRSDGRSHGRGQLPAVPTVAPAVTPVQATPSLPSPPKLPLHSPSDNRGSIIPISPGISSAVDFIRRAEEQKVRERSTPEKPDSIVRTEKETWRKSDSTNSHHTIRPGATGAKASRPSSMAESLQSNHTIIPANNKRLSALVADADFGMPEEDDLVNPWDSETPAAQNTSPTSSLKSRDRRSMSLHLGSQLYHKIQLPSPPATASLGEMKLLSKSISEGISSKEASPPPMRAVASTGTPPASYESPPPIERNIESYPAALSATTTHSAPLYTPPQQRKLPMLPIPSQSNRPVTPPIQSPSFRQTAISMTSGFAPAAGLAKRAVERVGRAWGLGSSSNTSGCSSSSSSTPPSSFMGASQPDHNVILTASNHSTPSIAASSHKKKTRTPNAPSGSWSISSSTTSGSVSDSDAFMTPAGPYLGIKVRGPMRLKSGGAGVAGGIVFGRDLGTVVKETAIRFDRPHEGGEPHREELKRSPLGRKGSVSRGDLRALEQRLLPALVVRCAQHLLIWGVQEEGLFRVSGRTSHIAKLRTEFDTGADYDMTGCTPGDLDPHAVASIFKAYLRELPEPILTHALLPYFEAAMNHESSSNPAEPTHSAKGAKGLGLPSNPRSSNGLPMIRKPPSLSTLALPSFAGMRPPSKPLLNALRSLIAQLPPENRDLIRTVAELIKATAKESKLTKMPLSNLLLVFCPSLNMNPPLLRVLCEGEDLWNPYPEAAPVLDIKRESTVLDISAPATPASTRTSHSFTGGGDDNKSSIESDDPDSDGPESESKRRTIVQDRPSPRLRNHISTIYLDTESYHESPGSTTADSTTSSTGYSDTASFKDDASYASTSEGNSHPRPDAPSPPLSSSAESLATPSNSSGQPSFLTFQWTRRFTRHLIPLWSKIQDRYPWHADIVIDRLSVALCSSVDLYNFLAHRKLYPLRLEEAINSLLSLPNLSAVPPDSPGSPSTSSISSRARRLKKPSLQLLFSKRSTSSLASPSSSPKPFISSPGPYLQTPRAASDSSVSTPISAVTAPQASTFTLPPVLDTPIQSSPLHLGLGIDLDSAPPTGTQASFRSEALVAVSTDPQVLPGETPIADKYHSAASSASSLVSPELKSHLRPYLTARSRQASVSSIASSNHLGLLDDEPEEDWTQSVLLAADAEGGWAIAGRQ